MSNLSIFAEHAQRHAATMGVGASAAAGQSYALLKRQDAEATAIEAARRQVESEKRMAEHAGSNAARGGD